MTDNSSFRHPEISSDVSSNEAVNYIIRKGIIERGIAHVGVGFLAGAMASVVLARGGTGARKVITAFGTGIGLGSAWTRTNMDLEELLKRV